MMKITFHVCIAIAISAIFGAMFYIVGPTHIKPLIADIGWWVMQPQNYVYHNPPQSLFGLLIAVALVIPSIVGLLLLCLAPISIICLTLASGPCLSHALWVYLWEER